MKLWGKIICASCCVSILVGFLLKPTRASGWSISRMMALQYGMTPESVRSSLGDPLGVGEDGGGILMTYCEPNIFDYGLEAGVFFISNRLVRASIERHDLALFYIDAEGAHVLNATALGLPSAVPAN